MLQFYQLTTVLIGQDCLGSHDLGSGLEYPQELQYLTARRSPVVHMLHLRRYSRRKVTQGQELWTWRNDIAMAICQYYITVLSLHSKPSQLIVSLTPPHVQKGPGVLSEIDTTYYDQERKGLMKLVINCRYKLKFPVSQTITKFSLMYRGRDMGGWGGGAQPPQFFH